MDWIDEVDGNKAGVVLTSSHAVIHLHLVLACHYSSTLGGSERDGGTVTVVEMWNWKIHHGQPAYGCLV